MSATAKPVFSVVVPTVGRPRQLERCLAAMSRLDYPKGAAEVVVVNDSGDGATDRVAAGWDDRVELTVVATPRAGPSAARNAGAIAARGSFIAFTDDDCEPESGWLRALQGALESNPGSAVGGTLVNGVDGLFAAGTQTIFDATHAHFNREDRPARFFATCNLAFPADAFRSLGGFDEDIKHAEDRDLCARWLQSGRQFVGAPEAVVRHMRELTPRQFWRQHYNYGVGAWDVRIRFEHGLGRFKIEPGFYMELGRRVWRRGEGRRRVSIAALALLAQIAYAAGFASRALSERGTRRQPSLREASQ